MLAPRAQPPPLGHSEVDEVKWSYFYLYVIIDIFNRRIVASQIADAESAALFKPLLDDAVVKPHYPVTNFCA